MSRRRSPRGQSVVETALASLVMVTVLLFGIHFAEVGYASVKTHEAAAYAAWSGTNRKVHQMPGATMGGYASGSAASASSRFSGGAMSALTQSSGARVSCVDAARLSGFVAPALGPFPQTGGMACSAQSQIEPFRIPTFFAQNMFQAQHKTRSITSCAFGRPSAGACNGQVSILLGDWALSNAGEEGDVPSNAPFSDTVNSVWAENGKAQGREAIELAIKYAGYAPYDLPFEMRVNDAHTRTVEPGSPGRFLGP